jgi:hypothetical protein
MAARCLPLVSCPHTSGGCHEICDSPPSDQPTPSSPLPARLLYDRDSCGVTAPRPAGTHNGTVYCAAPSWLTENSPRVQPKFGALSTSPPGGSPIGAAARPVNGSRAGGTDVHDDKTKATAKTAGVSSRAGLNLASIRRVVSIRHPQNGTDKKNRALISPGLAGQPAPSVQERETAPWARGRAISACAASVPLASPREAMAVLVSGSRLGPSRAHTADAARSDG